MARVSQLPGVAVVVLLTATLRGWDLAELGGPGGHERKE